MNDWIPEITLVRITPEKILCAVRSLSSLLPAIKLFNYSNIAISLKLPNNTVEVNYVVDLFLPV